jgi:dTDP-4-dehydrorhamnose 3,5-epimerase
MPVKFIHSDLPDVLVAELEVFNDSRGFFLETFHQRKYEEGGVGRGFVQDNHSHSQRNTLRGLHYQLNNPQGKLIYVVTGEVFDVAVDIRRGSPTFGKWMGTRLSAKNRRQLYIPEGFAHGFCVLSDTTDFIYKCTDFYTPGDEYGIFWQDSSIGIEWPTENPILSDKDRRNPKLNEVPESHLPIYQVTSSSKLS